MTTNTAQQGKQQAPQKPGKDKPGSAYKDTLNLPQTAFPMEAKLVQNEPKRLQTWREGRLYEKIQAARAHSPKGKWVLHDPNFDVHYEGEDDVPLSAVELAEGSHAGRSFGSSVRAGPGMPRASAL